VLELDDTDKDGRLSYSEFMAGRRRSFKIYGNNTFQKGLPLLA